MVGFSMGWLVAQEEESQAYIFTKPSFTLLEERNKRGILCGMAGMMIYQLIMGTSSLTALVKSLTPV